MLPQANLYKTLVSGGISSDIAEQVVQFIYQNCTINYLIDGQICIEIPRYTVTMPDPCFYRTRCVLTHFMEAVLVFRDILNSRTYPEDILRSDGISITYYKKYSI